jgi:hypothetical protein
MEGSAANTALRGQSRFTKPAVQLYKFDQSRRFFYEHQQLNDANHTFQPRSADAFTAMSCVPVRNATIQNFIYLVLKIKYMI